MKALVALLLILNVGFGAWQWSRPATPVHQPTPVDPGVEPLWLLSEIAGPAHAAVGIPSSEPSPSPSPTPTSMSPLATPAANPPPTPAPLAAQCYSLGPFTGLAEVTQLRQRCAGAGRQRATACRANPCGRRLSRRPAALTVKGFRPSGGAPIGRGRYHGLSGDHGRAAAQCYLARRF